MSIKFGLSLDFWSPTKPHNRVLDDYSKLLSTAEGYGFDSVWAGENRPSAPSAGHVPSPLMILAALAGRTQLRLGTAVTLLPLWQPLHLAYDGAILDHLSQGRFTLGVGTGNPFTMQQYGLPANETTSRMDETLELLKSAWGGVEGFQGQHFSYLGKVYPGPVQEGGPPILVGGTVPRAIRRATDMADGWIAATQFHHRLIKVQAERYLQRMAAQGKDPKSGTVAINRTCFVAQTDAEARREGKAYVNHVLDFYGQMGLITDNDGNVLSAKEDLFELVGPELVFVGSPETCIESIKKYEEIGVNQINLRVTMGDMPLELAERTVALFGEHVLPHFND